MFRIIIKFISMSAPELAELCIAILHFQQHVQHDKQQLFGHSSTTDQFIWKHMAISNPKLGYQQLLLYLTKHGSQPTPSQLQLLLHSFSSHCDQMLTREDLWQIFKPTNLAFTRQIASNRNQRTKAVEMHPMHFQAIDLITDILEKTIEFEEVAENMKHNIMNCGNDVNIGPIDAKHLQAYINPWAPELSTNDCQVILSHMLKNRAGNQKGLYSYLVPFRQSSKGINPNHHSYDDHSICKAVKTHAKVKNYVNKPTLQKKQYI